MSRLIYIGVLALYVLAIIDIWRSSKDNEKKILWTLVVLFLPLLGLILYYVIGKK